MRPALTARLAAAAALAFLVWGVLAVTVTPPAAVQTPEPPEVTYDYSVLPGIQPGWVEDDPVTRNLRLTCGWHTGACYERTPPTGDTGRLVTDGAAIDIGAHADETVYAVFRAEHAGEGFTARVARINPGGRYGVCKKVVVEIADASTKAVAEVSYTHTIALTGSFNAPIALPATGDYAVTEVGDVAAVAEEAQGCKIAGTHLHQWLVTENDAGVDYPGIYRNRSYTPLWWRELDLSTGTLAGNGFSKGYHPDPGLRRDFTEYGDEYRPHFTDAEWAKMQPGSDRDAAFVARVQGPTYAYPQFCSRTWVFKVQTPGTPAPVGGTNVEPCPPPGLRATPGDGEIALTWDNPGDPTVVRYEIRHRTLAEGASFGDWQSIGKVYAHTVPDLAAGATYQVQLRAVVKHGSDAAKYLRSPVSDVAAVLSLEHTLTVKVDPPECATPADPTNHLKDSPATASYTDQQSYCEFDEWSEGPTVTMDRDRTVTASFNLIYKTLTVAVSPSECATPADPTDHLKDSPATASYTDQQSYCEFDEWSEGPTVTMDRDRTVTASFNLIYKTLTVAVSPSECATPADPTNHLKDSSATASYTDQQSYCEFDEWSEGPTVTMDRDRTVTASFNLIYKTLTVAVSPSECATPADPTDHLKDSPATASYTDQQSYCEFDEWSEGPTVTMDRDRTVTASFNLIYKTLTVAVSPSECATPADPTDHLKDSPATASYTDQQSYCEFDEWSEGPTVTMDRDRTVTASFNLIYKTLTVAVSPSECATPADPTDHLKDSPATASYTGKADHCEFDEWSEGPTVTMDRDRTVTASFKFIEKTLTVKVSPHHCATPAEPTDYLKNSSATATYTDKKPYCDFDEWSEGPTVTMDRDRMVTASFTIVYHYLTVNVSGGGGASGAGRYLQGTRASVSAKDTDDWAFVRWEGDISSRSRSTTVFMSRAKTVTAVFVYQCDVGCRRGAGVDEGGPPTPGNVSVRLAEGTFTLNWDTVPGADRYRVRYRSDPEVVWAPVTDAEPTDALVTWSPESIACGRTYSFQVEARGDGTTYEAAWGPPATLGVVTTDCERRPVFDSANYAFSIAEDSAAGASVGRVAATPDAGLSYAITSGNAGGAFAIGDASGEITVAGALDSSVVASYTLTVRASDGRGGVATATVAITVVR